MWRIWPWWKLSALISWNIGQIDILVLKQVALGLEGLDMLTMLDTNVKPVTRFSNGKKPIRTYHQHGSSRRNLHMLVPCLLEHSRQQLRPSDGLRVIPHPQQLSSDDTFGPRCQSNFLQCVFMSETKDERPFSKGIEALQAPRYCRHSSLCD